MRYRMLGRTGLFVSEMCLGTMAFGANHGPYGAAGWLEEDEALPIFRRALDAGINFIDTANVYAGGRSEEITGRALKKCGVARHDIVIATKAEHPVGSGPNDAGASRHHLTHQVKESLRRLDTDYIDLFQLHGWDPATPIEQSVRALDDLVRQGHIRYVGVSNMAAWQVVKALGAADRINATPPQCLQAYYSLVGRDLEREILPMLEVERLGLLVYSPLAGGYLSGKYRNGGTGRRTAIPFPPIDETRGERVMAALEKVSNAHSVSLTAIAISWILKKSTVTSVILGAKSVEQLDQQIEALSFTLTSDQLYELDMASVLPTEYPAWMLRMNNARREALMLTGSLPVSGQQN